jgi:hypothetical protein
MLKRLARARLLEVMEQQEACEVGQAGLERTQWEASAR